MWKKVVGPTLLIACLWLSTSAATTIFIFWLTDSNSRILTENVASIRAAGLMQQSLWRLESAFLDAVTDPADSDRKLQFHEIQEMEEGFLAACREAERSATTDAEAQIVHTILGRFSEYRAAIDGRLQGALESPAGDALLIDRSMQMAQNIAAPCAELAATNERLMEAAVASRSRTERTYKFVRFGLLIAGPGIGIWVGFRIARSLHRSISQISVTLKDASGDLDQEIGNVEIVPHQNVGDLSVLNEQVQLISARIRQMLVELSKARREAQLSERLAVVGELAAGVAHEIRNPLTSVKLLMQTASRTDGTGIQLEDRQAHVILQEILRMEETIQTLLDFARPPQLHRIRHDLRDTLRRALNLVEGRAGLERVTVLPRISAVPLIVDGDPEQLHQVFVNLLINGIDSMANGGALHVTAESDDAAGVCRVIVADCGTGIPPERIERIFDPFVTTKPRGTGLGLAVTRRIVREHGGAIVARNRSEGGATFTVELQMAATGKIPLAPTVPNRAPPARDPALSAAEDS